MNRTFLIVLLAIVLSACGARNISAPETSGQNADDRVVTIMTFNVENLFDASDDPGKDDHTYLPRAVKDDPAHIAKCETIDVDRWREECLELDWNEDAVDFKLRQVASAILQVNDGRGPDIVALQEVENAGILTRLSRDYLAAAGYGDAILIEGQDLRGIDVAFLTRLPLVAEPVLHPLDLSRFRDRARDTRGLLEATFELPGGRRLTGFSVHFPAPYHPIEMREVAYDRLNELRAKVPGDHFVFASGDFNTPRREQVETSIMNDRVRPQWTVAHEQGCEGCKGTNYWATGDSWSFLDMILYSPARSKGSQWRLSDGGVFVADAASGQMNTEGTVNRFNLDAREGVSDHLPLVVTLEAVSTD